MKMEEIGKELPMYKIFIDLDGVLVDFKRTAMTVTGIDPANASKEDKRTFWKRVEQHVGSSNKFWGEMVPMKDAHILWAYIKRYQPTILSATGHIKSAGEEKYNWVKQYLGNDVAKRAIFVRNGSDKSKYAASYNILIDDRIKVLEPWWAAGGVGILHKSAHDTIQQLKAFGV